MAQRTARNMSAPIFTVFNNHFEDCGVPPQIDTSKGEYHGYFENQHGEQWIFVVVGGKALLYGGDAGWETAYPVVDGVQQG